VRELLEACWESNPDKRPSFDKIVQALDMIMDDSAPKDKNCVIC